MSEYTLTHPLTMWVYFGAMGAASAVLFTLAMWQLLRLHAVARGSRRAAARWTMVGYAFLFSAAWFACGIGGTPGNLLSPDPSTHDLSVATGVAGLAILLSVPGWACLLVAQWVLARDARTKAKIGAG